MEATQAREKSFNGIRDPDQKDQQVLTRNMARIRNPNRGSSQSPILGNLSEGEWEQRSETAQQETHTGSSPESEWEQVPDEILHPSQGSPQPDYMLWAWPERQAQSVSQNLEAALHPALRSNFRLQQHWDRAPEQISSPSITKANSQEQISPPFVTDANPQLKAKGSAESSSIPEPGEEMTQGRHRRRRSRAPSPDNINRGENRKVRLENGSDGTELNNTGEVPQRRHRRHRSHRSRSPDAKPREPHSRHGDHSRRRHHGSDKDRGATDREYGSSGHHSPSRHRDKAQSRTIADDNRDRDCRMSDGLQGEDEAGTTHNRHRRHRHRRERESSPDLPSRIRSLFLG